MMVSALLIINRKKRLSRRCARNLLDIDFGTYPFLLQTPLQQVLVQVGVAPTNIGDVWNIQGILHKSKAGPFPAGCLMRLETILEKMVMSLVQPLVASRCGGLTCST